MLTKNRNKRKQFLLDEETASQLKFIALTKATSENEIVNKALQSYFKRFKISDHAKLTKQINERKQGIIEE